jgi:hypothetical protein
MRLLPPQQKEHSILDIQDAHYRKVNRAWAHALEDVRQLQGFKRFLRPKSLAELTKAAANGPIVILNGSSSSCAAFVVTTSNVECVELSITKNKAQDLVELLRALLRGFDVGAIQLLAKIRTRGREAETSEPPDRHLAQVVGSEYYSQDKAFGWLLSELWTNVVRPIFDVLGLTVRNEPVRLRWF